jgi:Ribbon-helix-helix protein, copG family
MTDRQPGVWLKPSIERMTTGRRARGRHDRGIAHENGGYYSKDMQTISLKLPDDLLVQLEQEAKARRVTKSLLVRESLEKALRGQPLAIASCYDLARDLAGAVKRLPRDLADNPKYMEGFGE